ncbi:hypothetical protein GBA52_028901 [Prunus armeniaca]|nr:hypothetical protein GBA52_028901 [Prunus armeniaca]
MAEKLARARSSLSLMPPTLVLYQVNSAPSNPKSSCAQSEMACRKASICLIDLGAPPSFSLLWSSSLNLN